MVIRLNVNMLYYEIHFHSPHLSGLMNDSVNSIDLLCFFSLLAYSGRPVCMPALKILSNYKSISFQILKLKLD